GGRMRLELVEKSLVGPDDQGKDESAVRLHGRETAASQTDTGLLVGARPTNEPFDDIEPPLIGPAGQHRRTEFLLGQARLGEIRQRNVDPSPPATAQVLRQVPQYVRRVREQPQGASAG